MQTTLSTGYASSSWPSGCSCRWPARCWPTGAPTSSASSASRATRTGGWRPRASAPTAAASISRWRLANRGKRSIALNLRHATGLAVLHELLATADVFLTSLRPGALSRLGLDADTLRERYPRLIYARGHGFGVRGPDANQPGYDSSAFWARGGVGHILTPPERDYPISQRGAMGDRNGAMALAFGIAAALLKRGNTGDGSVVDVSLLATAMWMLSSDLLAALNGGEAAPVEWPWAASQSAHRQLPDQGRPTHPADVPAGRPLLAGVLPARRPRRPHRRPALRRPRRPARQQRGLRGRARRGVRRPHLCGVERAARRTRRAVGAGAIGARGDRGPAGRSPTATSARSALDGGQTLPAARPCPCSSTSRRRRCGARPSTASTPRRCCWSSATTGTASSS